MSNDEKTLILRIALKVHIYAEDARHYAADIKRARKALNKAFGKRRVDACIIRHHGRRYTNLLHPCGLAYHLGELAAVAEWLRDIGRDFKKAEENHG